MLREREIQELSASFRDPGVLREALNTCCQLTATFVAKFRQLRIDVPNVVITQQALFGAHFATVR
jgi:hypothetical protein